MIEKYFGGTLPAERQYEDIDKNLIDMCNGLTAKTDKYMDDLSIPQALAEIFAIVQRANKYIDETAPWVLAKDEANKTRLATVLYVLVESLRFVTTLLQAYLPNTSPKIAAQLGYTAEELTYDSLKEFGYKKEVTVHKGDVIFPRIDAAKELAAIAKEEEEKKAQREAKRKAEAKKAEKAEEKTEEISIDDFAKVNLIVGKIVNSEALSNSKKLLKNTVFDGKKERTILSGIHEWYEPKDLIGKKVIIIDNLAPRKMAGIMSEGMILATDNRDGSAKVIFVDDGVEPGSKIR